tara:strand:- start:7700 stop:8413 length:714 start_codon:yes stop_codon:yes gene_type:complete
MDFNFLNYKPPSFELPEQVLVNPTRIGDAPREIPLEQEEEKRVEEIKNYFRSSNISIDSLYSLFNDWQSDKTKSVKKFILSFSFVLSLAIVAGVNITEIDLFGVTVSDSRSTIFLITFSFIHLISFWYFEYLTRTDLKIHAARLSIVKDHLLEFVEFTKEIDQIVKKNNIESADKLFDDFRDLMDQGGYAINTYEAIKFYEKRLRNPEMSNSRLEIIEMIVIYFLGVVALLSILNSF